MPFPTRASLKHINHLLGVLASEAGIQSACAYLLAHVRRFRPVEQILCTLGSPDGDLIELAKVCRESGELPVMDGDMPQAQRFKVTASAVPGERGTVFLLERNQAEGTLMMGLHYAHYGSMLVLPVDKDDDGPPLCLTMMALAEGAFPPSAVAPCLAMTRDLRGVLAALFSLPRAVSGQRRADRRVSAVELLRMCRGLSDVLRLVESVAPLDATVLITGETGSGKEVVAESLRALSRRRKKPFLKLNCGAIPETLIDSTLFGHEKGSFTGAVGTQPGYFEQADGGTLFLDEVGELSPLAQTKLLRVLDRGEIQRVGSPRAISVDVRVLAATHRDLPSLVREGRFREDLLFRLSVFPIVIPPLRERRMDIPILARRFLEIRSKALGLDSLPEIGDEALRQLYAYDWPGNVRELEHRLEQALILTRTTGSRRIAEFPLPGGGQARNLSQVLTADPPFTLEEVNRLYIEHMLERTAYVLTGEQGAARLLGLPSSTLRSRMAHLGIASRGSRGRRRKTPKNAEAENNAQ